MSAITLYSDSDYFSPYVLSVFVALEVKKLPFEMKTLNLSQAENFDDSYAELSLTRRVPSIDIDGFSLSESSAIIELLEELYPAPQYQALFPADLRQRAHARQIQAWLRSDLGPLRDERQTKVIFDKPTSEPMSQAALQATEKLIDAADRLIDDSRPNLFDTWCIADTDFALMLNRLVANGDPVPSKIRHYVERQWAQPALQKWLNLPRSPE